MTWTMWHWPARCAIATSPITFHWIGSFQFLESMTPQRKFADLLSLPVWEVIKKHGL